MSHLISYLLVLSLLMPQICACHLVTPHGAVEHQDGDGAEEDQEPMGEGNGHDSSHKHGGHLPACPKSTTAMTVRAEMPASACSAATLALAKAIGAAAHLQAAISMEDIHHPDASLPPLYLMLLTLRI